MSIADSGHYQRLRLPELLEGVFLEVIQGHPWVVFRTSEAGRRMRL
jgi:hypothetical protein